MNFYFFTFELRTWSWSMEKNLLNIIVRMSVNPEKWIPLLRFLRTSYNSMSWGCSGMLKSRSDMDVVYNRRKSIRSLFRGYIPFGAGDIQVQNFNHLISSYLKWCACSQILAFLTVLMKTWNVKTIFEMLK